MTKLLLLLILLAPTVAGAQTQKPNSPSSPVPPLSEVEQLKIDKAELVAAIAALTRDVAQWRTLFAQASDALGKKEAAEQDAASKTFIDTVVKELEAARPGYKFDPQTKSFTPIPK